MGKPPDGTFATTFRSACADPRFAARARLIDVPDRLDRLPRGPFRVRDEWRLFRAVVRAARREKVLLLFSSRGYLKPELLAAAFIGLWPRRLRPDIVFYGEMYEPDAGARYLLERAVMKLADRAIFRYIVYSDAECEVFPRLWGVDRDKMRVCPFYRLRGEHDDQPQPAASGEHIFAGGNSFRDYEPLIGAAQLLPEREFVVCSSRLADRHDLPHNVRAGPVPHAEFVRLIETAAAVVVPLQMQTQRIAGMLTYLEAMWMGKPTIVSDALGVREYVWDGETGLVVDGSPECYADAIQRVLRPASAAEVRAMCRRARRAVQEQFTLENHVTQLLTVMDEAGAAVRQR